MKKAILQIGMITLTILVSAPIFVAFLSYHIQLKKIKREVKNVLIDNTPRNELVSFTFDMQSAEFKKLNWKHNKEFEYQRKMFDIVEADTTEGNVYYLCFPDKQETALNAKFNNLLNNRFAHDVPSKNNQHLISQFIKSLCTNEIAQYTYIDYSQIQKLYCKSHLRFSSAEIAIPSPPPQFFV